MFAIIALIVTVISLTAAQGSLRPSEFAFLDDEESVQGYSIRVKPLPCGYQDLYDQFTSGCKLTHLTNIFWRGWADDVITGKALLKQITYTCSKYDSYRRCANCTAKTYCPGERAELFESLIGEWSIFCDKDQVAGWLLEILQNGYSFNTSLYRISDGAFRICVMKLMDSEYRYNRTAIMLMSLSEGLDYWKTITSILFKCTVGEILARPIPKQECVASPLWQDIVLTLWLELGSAVRHGLNINQDEINMLQEMRC